MIPDVSICAVILTLNEEAVLARALSSVQWCDEVLVLDSGSTDKTAQIASDYGARFVQHLQEGPFLITAQRNYALNDPLISSDWILFLDADEEITPSLSTQIRHKINACSPLISGFELAPRYYFLGKWLKYTQSYPCWHPRIARKSLQSFTGGVWEQFQNQEGVMRITEPYEHYAFSKGLEDWIIRHTRYAKWEANRILSGSSTHNGRRAVSRALSDLVWPIRPLTGFMNKYFICRGFLDGPRGLLFALLMASYDLFIVVFVIQYKMRERGQEI